MATMIPTDGYFDPASGEKKMFDALSKLPEDYYVFHSYRLVQLIPDKGLNENEIDFLVFHPDYGCLFIECKNAKVERDTEGNWNYVKVENGNRTLKHMKDPFDQAFSGQHNLFNKLRETYPEYYNIINECKFMVAVWFPKYTKEEIEKTDFGPNITKEIIMTREAVLYKEETLAQIQALMERMNRVHLVCKYEEEYVDGPGYKHKLSRSDAMLLYNRVLCPTFRAIVNLKKDFENTYIELLEEQYVILEFLAHQRTAAISGAGGTGKTLVAVQRARLLSQKGEKVLFLCFNHNLMDNLAKTHKEELENVDFCTLDSYGCKKCNVPLDKLSYFDLKEIIELEMLEHNYEYKHIIVDEGQDFGKGTINDSKILELFADYGAGKYEDDDTSFFIFYDKNQMVNFTSKEMPPYLIDVDSKLTLYKNCRNTKTIATTAASLIDLKVNLHERAWEGEVPNFIFYSGKEEFIKKLDNLISTLSKEEQSSERVIISCGDSMKKSDIYEKITTEVDGRSYSYKSNGKKTRVYTCPTFKGLESEDVIVIDVSDAVFEENNYDFYVCASRAKKRLFVFVDRERTDIENILDKRFPSSFPNKDKSKQLAMAMYGIAK